MSKGGAPPPPAGFDAEFAMHRIFEVGTLVARATAARVERRWLSEIRQLQNEIRVWAAWEDERPMRLEAAAACIQAYHRRWKQRKSFKLAVQEARLRRRMAEIAATSIKDTTRRAQATDLVQMRRAAIAIQRIWRGVLDRRAAAQRTAQQRASRRSGVSGLLRSLSFSKRYKRSTGSKNVPKARGAAPAASTAEQLPPSHRCSPSRPTAKAAAPAPQRGGLLRRAISFDRRPTSRSIAAASSPASSGSLKLPERGEASAGASTRRSLSFTRKGRSPAGGLRTEVGPDGSPPGGIHGLSGAVDLRRTVSLFDDDVASDEGRVSLASSPQTCGEASPSFSQRF